MTHPTPDEAAMRAANEIIKARQKRAHVIMFGSNKSGHKLLEEPDVYAAIIREAYRLPITNAIAKTRQYSHYEGCSCPLCVLYQPYVEEEDDNA